MGIILNEAVAIKRLAERLILRCAGAERPYIAAFWLSGVAGYAAAVHAGLCVRSFSDRRLGCIFAYLGRCVECGERPFIDGCMAWLDRFEPGLVIETESDWVYRLILSTDTEAGRVSHYANRVRYLADIREHRARTALTTYAQLAAGDEYEVRVTLKRKPSIRETKRRALRRPSAGRVMTGN